MTEQVLAALDKHGVSGSSVRLVDLDLKPGVKKDMGDGDAWPGVRDRLLAADILVVATPTWMGNMSSVAARVLERLDAELSELDDEGRPLTFGKVALVAVVGNEDGAHKITASLSRFPCKPRVTNAVILSEGESSWEVDDECVECCFPAVRSGS